MDRANSLHVGVGFFFLAQHAAGKACCFTMTTQQKLTHSTNRRVHVPRQAERLKLLAMRALSRLTLSTGALK